MSPLLTVVLLGAALASSPDAISPKAELKVWAVEVHSEGRREPHFDKELEEIRDAVKDAKYDTYLNLKTVKHSYKDAKPAKASLNELYTLDTTVPTRAEDGRYRLTLRVTMKSKDAPPPSSTPGSASLLSGESLVPKAKNPGRPKEIEAMSSKLLLEPGRKLVVRGFKLDDGKEMVLVISLSVPEEEP